MTDWDDIRKQYGDVVWSTCYRILANDADALDCFQDVFLHAFSRSRPEEIENWGGWLRWLATRRAIDSLRRRRRNRAEPFVADVPDRGATPQDAAQLDELIGMIRDEVSRLPENQATAFWLACVEQVPHSDVARQMKVTSGHVGVLVHRARDKIKERLKAKELLSREP